MSPLKERKKEEKIRSHATKFITWDKCRNLISLKCTEATVQKEETNKTGVFVIFSFFQAHDRNKWWVNKTQNLIENVCTANLFYLWLLFLALGNGRKQGEGEQVRWLLTFYSNRQHHIWANLSITVFYFNYIPCGSQTYSPEGKKTTKNPL